MSLLELGTWIGVALAGAIGHEVAHWIVWTATGRRPKLHLWELVVTPRAGPETATAGDRVAAAAPYLLGLATIAWGVGPGSVLWTIFGLAMVGIPSRADIDTMRGRVTWRGLVA